MWQALVFLVVGVDRIVDGVMKTATFLALDSLTGDEITKPHVGFHIKSLKIKTPPGIAILEGVFLGFALYASIASRAIVSNGGYACNWGILFSLY